MSSIAAGPTFVLQQADPSPPPHSLLETAGVVLNEADTPDGRIPAVAKVLGFPEGTPEVWAECISGTNRVKDEGPAGVPEDTFQSFMVYQPVHCSFRGRFGYDEMLRKLQAALDARKSFAIARVLAHGTWLFSQPTFAGSGLVDLNPSGPVSAGLALSILDQAIGATGEAGLIHVTPATIDAVGAIPIGGGEVERLETAAGNQIVVDGGYIDPEKDFSGAADMDTVDWAFATGPVRVYLRGDVFVPDLEETLDRATNDFVLRPEQAVIAYWDTTLNVGVRVDWSS